ncbi:DUF1501 domain-containing protein [Candidatus Pseudothioglobus singularis]|jgi:uncharacterized protein (DUF1501 family)|nr:DUF1501 domain-containing protein [Candidatus Pseudothioglobus singularis]MBT4245649.1 DUF1501 domain-containing protein [Gammaproteobacteria bacterium]MDA9801475.1 DUF1501 domain-containing protein [Candidatus Pseudothioglobus singularis]MDB4598585.1 DUF1501 domain-containing protein [Candidatus Pseudothioglobus singularis]|tara:strand:+ start:708 stop:1853 length:1146 start_codon:yes stop_codon:yes gene_type:complete
MPNLTRREFLKASGASLFLAGLPMPGYTKDKPPGTISVIVLEGGMDGLTAVPPFGDPNLLKMRKNLVSENYLKLNSFFGLHPSFKYFAGLMAKNNAAVIHATNFPYTLRSHFEGQNLMQGAGLAPFSEKTGWLGRALDLAKTPGRAMSLDMPLILRGSNENDNFYPASILKSGDLITNLIQNISMTHEGDGAENFKKVQQKSTQSNVIVPRDPASLARYAGKVMSQEGGPLASVIKVDQFDTHANQGAEENGQHGTQLAIIDDIIAGYKDGLGDAWDQSIILTLTEFGRTVSENGTRGSDHGYGSAGLLAGGAITKSNIISQWPGLSKSEQFEQRDLMSTIDYRSVCAACIEKSLGLDHDLIAEKVFFTPKLPRLYDYIFS